MPDPDIFVIPNWSYSRLRKFEMCGFQALQVNVLKTVTEVEGEALTNGKIVHKIAEDYLVKGATIPKGHSYLEPALEPFFKIRGNNQIKLYVEHEMAIDRKFDPCAWYGPRTWGRARADALAIEGSKAVIADFKTGKYNPDAIEQLKLTAVLVFRHFSWLREVDLIARFLSPGAAVPVEHAHLTVDEIPAIWSSFVDRLQPMAHAYQTSEWRKKPGPYCKWCPVISCEYHRSRQ